MGGTVKYSSDVLERFKMAVNFKSPNRIEMVEVDGYRLHVPECPGAELFVHKHLKEETGMWCVSDASTGYQVCEAANKPAAVGKARRKIGENPAAFLDAVARAKSANANNKVK